MGLLEDLRTPAEPDRSCRLRTIFDMISKEEQVALSEAIQRIKDDERLGKSKQFSATWLADVLTSNGHDISRSSVTRHITGACSCEQPL